MAEADSIFLEATFEWNPSPLRPYCRITDDWWWLRIPTLGDLAAYLRRNEEQGIQFDYESSKPDPGTEGH